MNNLRPIDMLPRRLASRQFPSPEAEIVAHSLAEHAYAVDLDGMTALCRASLLPLMARTGLGKQAVYDGAEHLVAAGFLVNTDVPPLAGTSIEYVINVAALPPCPTPLDAEFPTQLESPVFWMQWEDAA